MLISAATLAPRAAVASALDRSVLSAVPHLHTDVSAGEAGLSRKERRTSLILLSRRGEFSRKLKFLVI
jgi:hypothetical protein